jgi:PAT family beta-lactamase induction signal transducer AmpG
VTVAGTTRSRLALFAGLYFAQGVPWGFFTVAIMLRLATLGMGPAAIGGVVSTAWLPWTLKPLLGPLVDSISFGRLGRRRPFILLAEVGMALSLLTMAAADPTKNLTLFSALLFLHNFFAAAQDVGTDALAIDILPPEERGGANGFMSAGKFAGVVVGGQGLLFVAHRAGWFAAYGAAIALLLIPALLVLPVRESASKAKSSHLIKDGLRLLSFRVVLVAAAFAVLVDASDSFLAPLVFPLLSQKLGFGEQQIATLSTVGGAVAALTSIVGGFLADRLGRRRTLALGCLGVAGFNVTYMLAQGYWGSYAFQFAYAVTSAAASGIVYASMLALFMDLTHPNLAATHFQIYMALQNARGAWGSGLGGRIAERLQPRTMFGLGAVIEILPLVLLPFLDPRKARERFERDG